MVKMKKHNLSISSFRLLGALFFTLFLFLALSGFGRILYENDDTQKRWNYFYDLPENSLEILILGNSHAYSTYSPNIIDAICETNSYVLASNSQKLEQTFFNLKEALKSQKPKVIVIQSSVLSGDSWKTQNGDYRVYSNLDGMRFSKNYLNALIEQRPLNDYLNTLVPILRNHANWKTTELISENMARMENPKTKGYRGFSPRESKMGDDVMNKFKQADKTDYSDFEISSTDLIYLEKIKKLSEEKKFKVLYVMSPKYPDIINPSYQYKSKALENALKGLGHEFVDFNLLKDEIGLEKQSFENGFIAHQHTSYYGAIQVSKYLASYLNKNHLKSTRKLSNALWKKRISSEKEYLLFGKDSLKKQHTKYSMNKEFALFDSIIIENLHIYKKEKETYELVIEFSENIAFEKLKDFKFYVHLIPKETDKNIREESRKYGFENFDFTPILLPSQDNKFFIQRIFKTKITKIKELNLGLFKTGKKERSAKLTIENISLN